MSRSALAIFTQRNTLILLLLGFASGLPLALTSGTLQAWMTVENVDIKTLGFFSLVGQAYVFKFLWSPMMDRYTPSFLGRRRGWILISQICLIIAIVIMGLMKPAEDLWMLATLAVIVAFCSASQDIAFDAYKTDLLTAKERGNGAAVSVLGYRLAMLISGGLALFIADRYLGWQATYWLMAALMLLGVFATLIAPEPANVVKAPVSLQKAIVKPLIDFFSRNNAWLILSLIVMYKMGDAFAASLSTPFLIRGVGFDPGEVGLINKTLGLIATIIGALYGGILMQRISLFRALMMFGLLQAVSNLGYWVLAVTAKNIFTMGGVIFLENICGGMGTAAFVALLMTLCNKSFSATQFALLSAFSAVGRVYVGPMAGFLVADYGWANFYIFSIVIAIPGLILLWACRDTLNHTQETDSFLPRCHFHQGYRWAIYLLGFGCLLMGIWLLLLAAQALNWLVLGNIDQIILQIGALCIVIGVIFGTVLDYCALRRSAPQFFE